MAFFLLLVCFFLSGFSALLYETAWTREFAFVFGTSELAVVAVLAAYMGGLALGAALAARWAPRIRRPVLVYGVLELLIALWALVLPFAVRGLRSLYLGWLGDLEALPETLGIATHAFHLLGTFCVLVPCTALMGATLPLLARHAVTRDEEIGPRVGLLYAVNTAGAIGGTLAAAFVLLPALGLRQTVYVGAAVNALVFAAAAALARFTAGSVAPAAPRKRGIPWILPAIAVSGAVSFGYEVLWFRMLGQLLGGSTAAFSTMLASFLAGIALGSAVASRFAKSRAAAATGFALAQLGTAFFARLGFAATDPLPGWATALGASVNNLGPGALLAMAVLIPMTLCVGASFPFAVRLLARDAREASASSARVYAWNTVGSIAGAVGTGYALLPWLGLAGTLVVGTLLNLALAVVASVAERPRLHLVTAAALAGAVAMALLPPARPDNLLRASPFGGGYTGDFRFFSVGRSSTVSLIEVGMNWRLTTNGLPESLISPRGYPNAVSAASWLSMLPVLARPEIRDMVIIGLGGGMTLGAVPASVAEIDVIELEPEVVKANRVARDRKGGDPLADPRVSVRLSDARGALILAKRRYDAIVSQPSHPWTSGASHLYTREFFELVESRLTDDGVFVQWIGAPFVDPERLGSLVAALNEVFEHVEVHMPVGAAIVMLSSNAPFDIASSAGRALAADPEGYLEQGIQSTEDVVAGLMLDAEASRAFSAGATPNSDDFNVLATAGLLSSGRPGGWVKEVFVPYEPLVGLADRLNLPLLARRLGSEGRTDRGERIAELLDPASAALFRGWIAFEGGRPRLARRHFLAALEEQPDLAEAVIGLAMVEPDDETPERLPARVRAVIDGRQRRIESPEALRALEPELASWSPGELLYREAAELRARWRASIGSGEEFEEARVILDRLISHTPLPRYLLLYAQVASSQGDRPVAWMALDSLSQVLNTRNAPEVAARSVQLALALGSPRRQDVVRRLRRIAAGGPGMADVRVPMGQKPTIQ